MNPCVFELDDFQTDEVSMYVLGELRRRNPKFRATCFTILGACDLALLRDLGRLDWLELAVHGLDHNTERFWGHDEAAKFLDYVDGIGVFSRLFKAPWFGDISDGFARALSERSYRVATRRRRQTRRLKHIPVYLGGPWTVYAHPPTLPDKLRAVDWEAFDTFYTVSEMFSHRTAIENEWVIGV